MNTDQTIVVTGASGFIGSRIVQQLLEEGVTVRGTVRTPEDADKYSFLTELPGADERLSLWKGELLTDGSFDEAVDGADFVIHTASPYVLDVEDPQTDLVDPAVEGTRNVLDACSRSDSVERVVVTSSMAAITDEPESDHVLTEADWNEKSSLERNPYYYSKKLAEEEAWQCAQEADWELLVINPFLVVGPSLSPSLNTSNKIFVDMLTGEYPVIMGLNWGIVDVRDVAQAHLRALDRPAAEGRFICVEHVITMEQVVELLRVNGYEEANLPGFDMSGKLGTLAVKIMAAFEDPGTRSYLRTNLGKTPRFDNTKIKQELGLEFRDVEETILETVADLKRWGHVADPGA
jgi:dihydroflavonol-4-reductase